MKEQVKAVRFTNWTDETFSHKWNSVEYTFKPGESTQLQDYLANHFANHLAQREINKLNLLMSDRRFKEFYDRCFSEEPIVAETEEKLEMKIEEIKAKDKKKAKAAKKVTKKAKKSSKPEDNFAGNETSK
jgi:hypothetical protein